MSSPRAVAPRESGRIEAVDVARGFALLGIFLVNIDYFALPLGAVMEGGKPEGGVLDQAAWWVVSTLCTGKFYPLFAMLFGIGLLLQRRSIESHGGPFVPIYLRRTLLLMAIGLVHGVFIWYGDILFIYSFAALVLLACSGLGARWLLGISAALIVVATVLTGATGALSQALAEMAPAGEVSEVSADEGAAESADQIEGLSPFRQWVEIAPQMSEGPADPRWMELESLAYREGGYLDTLAFRAISFFAMLISMLFGAGWHVLAMFFLGAGLFRAGLLEPEASGLRRRLLVLGFTVGLPLAIVSSLLKAGDFGGYGVIFSALVNYAAGPLLALGYLLAWVAVVEAGALRRLTSGLASTGRLALTNYLSQSLVASAVMYYWGLGLFGTVGQFSRDSIAVGVFVLQLLGSAFWMSRFRFGPVEWLWRSATYLQLQPWHRPRSLQGEQ